jgi:hypothetical protein
MSADDRLTQAAWEVHQDLRVLIRVITSLTKALEALRPATPEDMPEQPASAAEEPG